MPSRKARVFLKALATLSAERPRNTWFSMDEVANRLGVSFDEAAQAALEGYDAKPRLVDIAPRIHLVTLTEEGRRAAKKS